MLCIGSFVFFFWAGILSTWWRTFSFLSTRRGNRRGIRLKQNLPNVREVKKNNYFWIWESFIYLRFTLTQRIPHSCHKYKPTRQQRTHPWPTPITLELEDGPHYLVERTSMCNLKPVNTNTKFRTQTLHVDYMNIQITNNQLAKLRVASVL